MRTTAAGGPVAYKAPPAASIGTWEGAVGVAVGFWGGSWRGEDIGKDEGFFV